MRVCHVITRLIVGGAQENTVATVLGLLRKPGVEVELISGLSAEVEGSLDGQFDQTPGVLRIMPDLVRPIRPWKDLRAMQKLTQHFRQTRPDIVHTHSGKAGIVGRFAARAVGTPCIVHTIHGPSFGNFQGRGANAAFRNVEKLAGRFTTHFISVAQAMTKQYLTAGIGRRDQYTRIFSGFALEPFLTVQRNPEMRAILGIGPGDFVITKVARLFELKGHDDLFASAPAIVKAIPNAKFLLVGDGTWRDRFERMASTPELKGKFIFAGLVAPAEVPKYLGASDVVVHLSRREGLPRALSQALAAGLPTVAYDCDGAGEVCLEGQTGFLVQPGDMKTLSVRLEQLARSPDLRERLGGAGREFVRKNFSEEKMVDEIFALYQRLLRGT